ncbi:MAG: cysteine synthase A, partial [Akkermansia sp.]
IPSILDVSLLDEVMSVTSDDAIQMARRLNGEEGIPVGISSGCNVQAAMMLARRPEYEGKRIVTVASSAVERYMSTVLVQQVKEKVMNLQVDC